MLSFTLQIISLDIYIILKESKEIIIAVSCKVSDTFNKIFTVNYTNFIYLDAFLGYKIV